MRKIMLIGLALLFSMSVFAQRTALKKADKAIIAKTKIAEQSDPKARALLNKVHEKYDSYKSLELELKLTIQDGDYKEIQNGIVSLLDNKYKVESDKQDIICDGRTNWVYLKEDKELHISNPEPDGKDFFTSPSDLVKSYERDFIYALVGEGNINGQRLQMIEFKPVDKKSEYSKVRVGIDKKSSEIRHIKVFEKSNIHYSIDIAKLVPNKKFASGFFVFDESRVPEDQIVDLRD